MSEDDITIEVVQQFATGKPVVVEIPDYGRLLVVAVGEKLAVGLERRALRFIDPNEDLDVFGLVSNGFPTHVAFAVSHFATLWQRGAVTNAHRERSQTNPADGAPPG